ncbi:hypothetical protein CWI38_0049p0010 [Hamiltosporidium tvaerminnensis]|uniref:Uncharacterized protein n=1 Tax=Hamiltosporidium tvaerminnensis TaxID=1176355 RepID=A0A4Q9M4A5_9MICR|nr:hypothetical protein CWI38_0049p0010 [Hamiltosporidium tvaerminnensis]
MINKQEVYKKMTVKYSKKTKDGNVEYHTFDKPGAFNILTSEPEKNKMNFSASHGILWKTTDILLTEDTTIFYNIETALSILYELYLLYQQFNSEHAEFKR